MEQTASFLLLGFLHPGYSRSWRIYQPFPAAQAEEGRPLKMSH